MEGRNRLVEQIRDLEESIVDLEDLVTIYISENKQEAADRLRPWIDQDKQNLQVLQQKLSGVNGDPNL